MGIFLVWDMEGVVFFKKEEVEVFVFNIVIYFNIEKLAMACCIFVGKFQAGEGCCVELIKYVKSQKVIFEYFIQWIGLEWLESSCDLINIFLEMVNELFMFVDEEIGEVMLQ